MTHRLRRNQAEDIVSALSASLKALALYPPGHKVVERTGRTLWHALTEAFEEPQPLLIGCTDGYLVVGDQPIMESSPAAEDLVDRFQQRKLEGVFLAEWVRSQEIARFCQWLVDDSGEAWEGEGIRLTPLEQDDPLWEKARRAHRTAVDALHEAYREAEEGRIPDAARARACVRDFSELLQESPSLLHGLVLIKDYDRYTFHHSVNVCLLALGLGRHMGLTQSDLDCLGIGAILHDIGKTRTPAEVIHKPGRLSSAEWSLLWRHPEHGRDILREMGGVPSESPRLVFEHHMRHDGGGYPVRPASYAVSPLSWLVSVSDIYDAMTTHRPYSAPLPLPEAARALLQFGGSHIPQGILDAFLAVIGRIPVGSVVRLRTGEVAVVRSVGEDGEVSEVIPVVCQDGRRYPPAERTLHAARAEDVVRWVDPLTHRIDPLEVLRRSD